jgi:hypothetical protein
MLVWFCLKFIIHIFLLSGLTYNPTCTICQGIMSERIVYVIQEVAGTQAGNPKINIVGASSYGQLKFLLPEFSQMIFSPGPLIYKLRQGLKNFTEDDHLLLTGDPALIGVACSIVSDITNGKYNLLKWDKQERKYYPIAINLYEKGEIDGN